MTDAPPPTGPPTSPGPPTGPPTSPGPRPGPGGGSGGGPPVRPLLDVGVWLTDTTRTLVKGFGEFFAVLAIVSLLSAAAATPLLWLGSRSAVLARNDDGVYETVDGLSAGEGSMLAAGVVLLLLSLVFLFAAATVHLDRIRHHHRPTWKETMALTVRRVPRVVGVVAQLLLLALVLLMAVGVVAVLIPGAALVAGPLSFVVLIWMWLRSAVASTHAGLGMPRNAVKASFVWSRRRLWPLLGRHVLLLTIVFGIVLISSFLAAPFQSLGGATASSDDVVLRELVGSSVPAFLARQIIGALASGLAAAVWASAMLSLYRGDPAEV